MCVYTYISKFVRDIYLSKYLFLPPESPNIHTHTEGGGGGGGEGEGEREFLFLKESYSLLTH
jgi:hypothetical protein